MGSLPHEAKVVVIGGGIAGCSTAYHLADNGWNTVLIERDVLTSGTTWHAAGMVTQLGTTPQITKIRKNSVKFYNDLIQGGKSDELGVLLKYSPSNEILQKDIT